MKRFALLFLALLLLVSAAGAEEVWEKSLGEEITAVATDEYGDRIFVGTESGMLYCYDSAGSVVWSVPGTGRVQEISCAGDGSKILVRSDTTGGTFSYYISGTQIWSASTGYLSTNCDLSVDGKVSLIQWSNGWIHVRDETGKILNNLGTGTSGALGGDAEWYVTTHGADVSLSDLNPQREGGWLPPYNSHLFKARASHSLIGSPDGVLTDHTVEITVIRGAGTSGDSIIYAPECRSDFADIRFTTADGVTEIPYYLKSVVGNTATFRVQVPVIPAYPGTATIYMYWFYPLTITTTSNLTAIGELHDDFNDGDLNTAIWTPYTGTNGNVTETGGYLELLAQNGLAASREARISSVRTFDYPVMVQANVSVISTYGTGTNLRNRFSFLSPSTEAGIFNMGSGVRYYWDTASATPSSLDTYINHTMVFIPSTSFEWVAGSEYTDTKATAVSSLRIVMAAGDGGTGFGHMRIDNISVTKYTPNPPTHGAWGVAEYVVKQIDTKPLDGTIVDIDAPETGDWVAVSTTTKTYIIQITDSGFGTVYSADRTGTPYQIQVADGGSFAIEGRNILADIFRIDAVQVGTYTTGGPVQHVALAQKNGLYAAAGSDDGKYYIFSKDETSAWYLLYASDSYDPVTALAMSWRGEYTVIGRSDGRLTVYQASEDDTDGMLRITVFKENTPYTNQTLYVEDGGMDQEWGAPTQVTTDDYGVAAVPVTWGHYTRITVGDDELVKVIVATSSQTEYVFRVPGAVPLRTGAQFGSSYDSATQRIYLSYDDTRDTTHLVVYEIARVSDGTVVYSEEFTEFPVSDYYQIPAGWTNTSYRVSLTASGSPSFTNTWSQWVGTAGVASPPGELDNFMKMGISFFLILFVAGLFSYLSGPQGAVVVSLFAGALVLWGWLPIAPAIVALCIVWAFLGLLGRTAGEG